MSEKIAVVTGASRGIGRAIACRLASEGIRVIINYNGSVEQAEQVQRQIREAGGQAEIYQCNVADFASCETFVSDVLKTWGRIDILVNNAGITRDGLLMRMAEEDFDQVLDTNLKGAFHMMRFVSRQMLKAAIRTDHQYGIRRRNRRKCRTGELCRVESRCDRVDEGRSEGAGIAGNYGKCSGSGLYRNGHDGSALQSGTRCGSRTDSDGTFRDGRTGSRDGGVSGFGRGFLYDRTGAAG